MCTWKVRFFFLCRMVKRKMNWAERRTKKKRRQNSRGVERGVCSSPGSRWLIDNNMPRALRQGKKGQETVSCHESGFHDWQITVSIRWGPLLLSLSASLDKCWLLKTRIATIPPRTPKQLSVSVAIAKALVLWVTICKDRWEAPQIWS